MSLEQEPKVIQPSAVENHTPTDERQALDQTPQTVKGQLAELFHAATSKDDKSHQFLLRVVQPGLAGLMDGSVSTLAPIFATAFATHHSFTAFLVGMGSSTSAGISMAFSEGLSDDCVLTRRGSPLIRWNIHRFITFLRRSLHTLP